VQQKQGFATEATQLQAVPDARSEVQQKQGFATEATQLQAVPDARSEVQQKQGFATEVTNMPEREATTNPTATAESLEL
jgi:hypothetical protein